MLDNYINRCDEYSAHPVYTGRAIIGHAAITLRAQRRAHCADTTSAIGRLEQLNPQLPTPNSSAFST